MDKIVCDAAAPTQQQARELCERRTSGTMPIGTLLQVEHVAMTAEASPMRFYARSMLLLGIGVSIRIQDALRSMPEEKGMEEDRVVSKIKWSKPGHPIWVVAPLE
eukprot:2468610-Pleurochrysis_carterae.AAC.1